MEPQNLKHLPYIFWSQRRQYFLSFHLDSQKFVFHFSLLVQMKPIIEVTWRWPPHMVDICAIFNGDFGYIFKHDGFRSGKGKIVLVNDDICNSNLAVFVFVQHSHNLKMQFNQIMLILYNSSKRHIQFVLINNNFKKMFNLSKSASISKENESSKLRLTTMNVNRFAIDFDSESSSESEKQQSHEETKKNVDKIPIKRLENIVNSQCKMIKPSIMNQKESDGSYEEIIDFVQPKTARPPQKARWFSNEPEKIEKHSYNESEKKLRKFNQIFKISYSSDSSNQPEPTEHEPVKSQIKQSNIFSAIVLQENEKRGKIFDKPNPEELKGKIWKLGKEKDETSEEQQEENEETEEVSLIDPSEKVLYLSSALMEKIFLFKEKNVIKTFLMTPIPEGIRFQFQIHQYKKFMKTQYQFWFCFNEEMKILATSLQDSISLDSHIFRILMKTSAKSGIQTGDEFLGKIASDFKRNQYTLFDHEMTEKPKDKDKILATMNNITDYLGKKAQELFVPKMENKKQKTIFNNTISKSLKKLYSLKQFQDQIHKYKTLPISQKKMEILSEKMKIQNNTTRNCFVKDLEMNQAMLFLKIQSGRFKIFAGPGLTPLQILAYATVHLE